MALDAGRRGRRCAGPSTTPTWSATAPSSPLNLPVMEACADSRDPLRRPGRPVPHHPPPARPARPVRGGRGHGRDRHGRQPGHHQRAGRPGRPRPGGGQEVEVRLGVADFAPSSAPVPVPYAIQTILDEFAVPAMAFLRRAAGRGAGHERAGGAGLPGAGGPGPGRPHAPLGGRHPAALLRRPRDPVGDLQGRLPGRLHGQAGPPDRARTCRYHSGRAAERPGGPARAAGPLHHQDLHRARPRGRPGRRRGDLGPGARATGRTFGGSGPRPSRLPRPPRRGSPERSWRSATQADPVERLAECVVRPAPGAGGPAPASSTPGCPRASSPSSWPPR